MIIVSRNDASALMEHEILADELELLGSTISVYLCCKDDLAHHETTLVFFL